MWFDVLVIGILVFTTVRGAMKGFVWQLATISALVLCFLFAKTLSASIAPSIPLNEPLNRWVSMVVLYLFLSFLCFTAARQLKDWIDKAKLTEYDRQLGGIFGFIKGAAVCLVITFFLVTLSESLRGQILRTRSGHFAAVVMDRLHPVMPAELHAILEPYIHKLDQPGMDLDAHDGEPDHEHDLGEPGKLPGTIAKPPSKSPSLPMVDNDVWGMVMDLLKTLPPEQRDELQQRFQEMSPNELISYVKQLKLTQTGTKNPPTSDPSDIPPPFDITLPEPEETPPPFGTDPQERARLLNQLASELSSDPAEQRRVVREIEGQLVGVPEKVAVATLRDFYVDLMSVLHPETPTQRDPDPGTRMETNFDTRLVRQLDKAGIPIQTLSRELQNRLRE